VWWIQNEVRSVATSEEAFDQTQFIRLLTDAQRPLYGFIYALVPVASDAEDVLQETNVGLWEQSERYRPGSNFLAWARTVAYYKILDHRKLRRKVPRSFDEPLLEQLFTAVKESPERSERAVAALAACHERLRPRYQQMLADRYAAPPLSVRELALKHGTTVGVISQTLYRIRKRLLACIQRRLAQENA
jgi:RNA polymerase sigma-70 factor (ECF subfamily)